MILAGTHFTVYLHHYLEVLVVLEGRYCYLIFHMSSMRLENVKCPDEWWGLQNRPFRLHSLCPAHPVPLFLLPSQLGPGQQGQ